jgi:hypothetical protein
MQAELRNLRASTAQDETGTRHDYESSACPNNNEQDRGDTTVITLSTGFGYLWLLKGRLPGEARPAET